MGFLLDKRYMVRFFNILCKIVLLIYLVSCTAVVKEHYFSPSSEYQKSNLERVKASGPFDPLGGVPNQITIYGDLAKVQIISLSIDETPLLIGPAIFPIIPAFLFDFEKTKITNNITLNLIVIPSDTATIDTIDMRKTTISSKEFGITYPDKPIVLPDENQLKWFDNLLSREEILYEFELWRSEREPLKIELQFELTPAAINEFELHIGGIVINGNELVLPSIKFTKSSGLAWGM